MAAWITPGLETVFRVSKLCFSQIWGHTEMPAVRFESKSRCSGHALKPGGHCLARKASRWAVAGRGGAAVGGAEELGLAIVLVAGWQLKCQETRVEDTKPWPSDKRPSESTHGDES